ncbi:hypothetical protein RIF29_23175 [Crotalaria pallida]|uniref:Uncharacterized protein n=1 Tax=Crotalaria pallida TaxID=3830 RepID=A0AAN9I7B2_CROPI
MRIYSTIVFCDRRLSIEFMYLVPPAGLSGTGLHNLYFFLINFFFFILWIWYMLSLLPYFLCEHLICPLV